MSVLLARRLFRAGTVAAADVEGALLRSVQAGVPLLDALSERQLDERVVHGALAAASEPVERQIEAHAALYAELPPGMCERLLALPLAGGGSRLRVAAVVPDPHLAAEFSYHLDRPVTLVRAPHDALQAALRLVRERVRGRRAGRPRPAERRSAPGLAPSLERAANADEVIVALAAELCELCRGAAIFASRGDRFDGRIATDGLDAVRELTLHSSEPSVLSRGIAAGYFFGPLPDDPFHTRLGAVLGAEPGDDVYSVPVLGADRVARVVVAAHLLKVLDSTRQMDELVRRAGEALMSIVRRRKQGEP